VQHRVRYLVERGGVQRQPSAAALCSVATPRSIARAPAAIACVPAAPGSALDSRSRTRAALSLPRPASSPMLNVLASQQRLQLRDVQDHRPAPGRTTSAHAQQRYPPRPGEHPETPEPA
jgi:hypothetical protein